MSFLNASNILSCNISFQRWKWLDGQREMVTFIFPYIFIVGYIVGAISIKQILVLILFDRISYYDKTNPQEITDQKI